MARALLPEGLLLVLLLVPACEKRVMTDKDCRDVKERLERAWNTDATAAQRLADTDSFSQFIGEEEDRLGDAWMKRCEPLVGKEVSERELECLHQAETLDDVLTCGGR